MALRGKPLEEKEQRLRALIYGGEGVGKTYFAVNFPSPYIIYSESGLEYPQYRNKLSQNGGQCFKTYDFFDMQDEIISLMKEKHNYKTLIIDSITPIYNFLHEWCEKKITANAKDPEKALEYNAANKLANRYFKRLYLKLTKLDMNVIFTAREKNVFDLERNKSAPPDKTFDAFGGSSYEFDLVLHIEKIGKNRIATIKKTRIEQFNEFEKFDFSYEEVEKRYGKARLEKNFMPIDFVSDSTLTILKAELEKHKYTKEQIKMILSKRNISDLSEMPEAAAQKYIDHLKSKEVQENVRV